jgi:uncharacterized protein (DUF433 family)
LGVASGPELRKEEGSRRRVELRRVVFEDDLAQMFALADEIAYCSRAASPLGFGMLDWKTCSAVERSEDKVSGAWVFKNTRVPVKALFENLESSATIDQFLEWFPGVTREQAQAVLEFAERTLVTS